ncbi:BBE domain-containing protein [Streptomyces sp. OE57]|uniref:BBE domain-containing protein n=1 Tax=Streptomyces lacaronensis TaxID=3379885 RepID=UPI0039B76A1B
MEPLIVRQAAPERLSSVLRAGTVGVLGTEMVASQSPPAAATPPPDVTECEVNQVPPDATAFGANYDRLVRVNREYDPTNFFSYPQAVGT